MVALITDNKQMSWKQMGHLADRWRNSQNYVSVNASSSRVSKNGIPYIIILLHVYPK